MSHPPPTPAMDRMTYDVEEKVMTQFRGMTNRTREVKRFILPPTILFVALLLSFFCLLAGSTDGKSSWQSASMMTVNVSFDPTNFTGNLDTSSIEKRGVASHAAKVATKSAGSSVKSAAGSVQSASNPVSSSVSNVASKTMNEIESEIKNLTKAVKVERFYGIHLLTYCNRHWEWNAKDHRLNQTSDNCTRTSIDFFFQPKVIAEDILGTDTLPSLLNWPSSLDVITDGLKATWHAMSAMYLAGIFLMLVSFTGCVFFLFSRRPERHVLFHRITYVSCGFSLFCLLVASSISSILTRIYVPMISEVGKHIGVTAQKGQLFSNMSWAATCLLALTCCYWIAQWYLIDRRERKMSEEYAQRYPDEYYTSTEPETREAAA